jgi:hypothetical protein
MNAPLQLADDLFSVLLYRDDATELLLESTPEGLRLPAVTVPARTRVADKITAAIKISWNLEAYCLFSVSKHGPPHTVVPCQVVEVCRADAKSPAGMQWFPVASLAGDSFEDPGDFAVLENSLSMLDQYRRGELPGPFGKPGWLRTVTEWIETQAAVAGLCLTGEFRQFNASPAFSLIRFETDSTALWFKAVGNPNLREYHVTLKLASTFPYFVPRIIGSQPDWNAWLSLEWEGCHLDANSAQSAWVATAENLALLQISSFGRRFALINAGCKDLRPCSLVCLVDPFLEVMTELMGCQTKSSPAPLSGTELLPLGCAITSSLKELAECSIPDTLGHLDFNPGNLLVFDTRCVFLDWAEGYVGPPFFTFQYLLEQWRRIHAVNPDQEQSLVSAYARLWTCFASPKEISDALRVVPMLAVFAYAVGGSSWRNRESIRPETAAYLRSLTRRMKREADALRERSLVCVP